MVRGQRENLVDAYVRARAEVIAKGFASEIDWQSRVKFQGIGESDFLREAAWVVLNSGMRERVVRNKFPAVSRAFLDWRSSEAIVERRELCRRDALKSFAHKGKIDAIVSICFEVADHGFAGIRNLVSEGGVEYLGSLAYIGPVTRYHLAKNLGLDVVKPDRHLSRVTTALGFGHPQGLCELIAEVTGDRLAVVDLVIWRFATLRPDYLSHFTACLS